jgi:hypothetical protein
MKFKVLAACAAAAVGGGALLINAGCEQVKDALESVVNAEVPSASLARVDLVQSPSVNTLMQWSCLEYLNSTTCALAGWTSQPSDSQLRFSFDIVFDLLNPNAGFSIPLIETLVGINVFEDTNLGAVCVSFCDPDDPSCEPAADAEGACDTEGSTELLGADDLIPTVDQLLSLASDVATGTLDDNWDYRVIPAYSEQYCDAGGATCTEEEVDGQLSMCCDGECTAIEAGCSVGTNESGETCALCDGFTEAHIQFDFGVDPFMQMMGALLEDAVNDFITSGSVNLNIPYTLEGTLFFDVPELGAYNLGYGPFDDTWNL